MGTQAEQTTFSAIQKAVLPESITSFRLFVVFQWTFVRFLLPPLGGENRGVHLLASSPAYPTVDVYLLLFLWHNFHAKMVFAPRPKELDFAIEPFPSFPGLCGYG